MSCRASTFSRAKRPATSPTSRSWPPTSTPSFSLPPSTPPPAFPFPPPTRTLTPPPLDRYPPAAPPNLQPVLLLNKSDLCDRPAEVVEQVQTLIPGVPVHAVSGRTGEGLEALTPYLGT